MGMNGCVPQWCVEAWVITDSFYRLGFAPEHVFFGVMQLGGHFGICPVVVLKVPGHRDYGLTAAWNIETGDDETKKIWTHFVEELTAATDLERDCIRRTSRIEQSGGADLYELAQQIAALGIPVPRYPPINALGPSETM